MSRTCDSCSECCKGWLPGSVRGKEFYPGMPCFFLHKTCAIYEDRPESPCKNYKCHWLDSDDLPMWMRPDLSKVIVTKRRWQGIQFYEVAECGQKIDSSILSWILIWAFNNNKNVKYQVDGGWSKVGSEEFLEAQI